MTYHPYMTTFALILMSFSRSVVSDYRSKHPHYPWLEPETFRRAKREKSKTRHSPKLAGAKV